MDNQKKRHEEYQLWRFHLDYQKKLHAREVKYKRYLEGSLRYESYEVTYRVRLWIFLFIIEKVGLFSGASAQHSNASLQISG